jgi:mono/diheme cytochrome c family protein
VAVAAAAAWCATAAIAAQEHPASPHAHPEGQDLKNPVAAAAESVGAGAKLYARHCANCHGTSGGGNGKLAAGVAMYGKRPSDLTDDVWDHGGSDGEIFLVIRDGVGPESNMDAYGRALAADDIWNLVNYIRTLAIPK